jgi:hypothetical protein
MANQLKKSHLQTAIIPVLAIFLVSLLSNGLFANSDFKSFLKDADNGNLSNSVDQKPIKTVEEMNKFLSMNIKYPLSSRTAGETGSIVVFAKVDGNGIIEVVSTDIPKGDYVELKGISITGYLSEEEAKPNKIKSSNHENLVEEAKRVVNSFPKLEIAELQNQTIKFQFSFDLRHLQIIHEQIQNPLQIQVEPQISGHLPKKRVIE